MFQSKVSHNRMKLEFLVVAAIVFAQLSSAQPVKAAPATSYEDPILQQTPCQEAWERVRSLFQEIYKVELPFLSWRRIVVMTDAQIEGWYLDKIASYGGHRWSSYADLETDLKVANLRPGRQSPEGHSWHLPREFEQDPCSAPPSGGQPASQSVPVPTTEVNEELQLELAIQQTYAMFEADLSRSGNQSAPVGVSVGSGSFGEGILGAIVLSVLAIATLAFLAAANRRRAHA